ncbi:MAG: helix-turn-helix domain-containing protein [Polyangiales bacterium]
MQPTTGRGEMIELGPARLWRVRSPASVALRGHGGATAAAYAGIFLQIAGVSTIRLGAREEQIAPGELSVGGGRPIGKFEVVHSADVEHLILGIPRGRLSALHPGVAQGTHIHRAADPGVRLLSEALMGAARDAHTLDVEQARILLSALLQLAGLPRVRMSRADEQDQRVRRGLRMIDEQLHDSTLNAQRIADACALSRRHLDQLFVAAMNRSVSSCILEARLARASAMLADSANAAVSITEIGFATGFNDAAQFSRAFRARFDGTPSQFRRAMLASASDAAVRRGSHS